MICNNENSIPEDLKEIENIMRKINKLEEEKYGFIENKENEGTIKIVNQKIFNSFIKECFNTALLYLILTMLIPLLVLLVISKFKLNLGDKNSVPFMIFNICIIISFTAYIISSIVNIIMCNFSSFLAMFICGTVFLCFISHKINNNFSKIYLNDHKNNESTDNSEFVENNQFMEKFFLIITMILTFLYLMNNFTSITLIVFCWIMCFVSSFLFFSSLFVLDSMEEKTDNNLYILNNDNNLYILNNNRKCYIIDLNRTPENIDEKTSKDREEKIKKYKIAICMLSISLPSMISFIILLCLIYKLKELSMGMDTFNLKNIKWCIIGIIYREFMTIILKVLEIMVKTLDQSNKK